MPRGIPGSGPYSRKKVAKKAAKKTARKAVKKAAKKTRKQYRISGKAGLGTVPPFGEGARLQSTVSRLQDLGMMRRIIDEIKPKLELVDNVLVRDTHRELYKTMASLSVDADIVVGRSSGVVLSPITDNDLRSVFSDLGTQLVALGSKLIDEAKTVEGVVALTMDEQAEQVNIRG